MLAIIITAITLALIFPFYIKIKFSFDSRRKALFAKIYLFKAHILTVRGVMAQHLMYTFGKKARILKIKGEDRKKIKIAIKGFPLAGSISGFI
ncbi:MAG: hypothetical protein EOM87_05225, partial [Clostridia bacterium]|nr:hypothetical protein [Clostridia bacterium]